MQDNPFAAVGAIVLRGNTVLLVRHTYGSAAGKLLNPGGFLQEGELPYDAVRREVLEETGVTAEPTGLIAIRCSAAAWYMVFLCRHVAGEPHSDNRENNEALYMDCESVLRHPEVTSTAKSLLQMALESTVLPLQDARKGRIIFSASKLPGAE